MPKRTPLTFNSDQLNKNLKYSTGEGVGAFFSPQLQRQDQSPTPKPKKTQKTIARVQIPRKTDVEETIKSPKSVFKKFLKNYLREKNTTGDGLRYPERLMSDLDDLPTLMKSEIGIKPSKTTIFIIGLTYILWDYQQNGKKSILYKTLSHLKE